MAVSALTNLFLRNLFLLRIDLLLLQQVACYFREDFYYWKKKKDYQGSKMKQGVRIWKVL